MLERSSYIINMNRLSKDKRAQAVAALVEGNSIRSTVRMTGVAKGTVLKLLADLGAACSEYQRRTLVGIRSKRIQCDEIWSFCYAKEKNVPEHMKGKPGIGIMDHIPLSVGSHVALYRLPHQRRNSVGKPVSIDSDGRIRGVIPCPTAPRQPVIGFTEDYPIVSTLHRITPSHAVLHGITK